MSEKSETVESSPQYMLDVNSSPHVADLSVTTGGVMMKVLIGLIPLVGWSFYLFGMGAVKQVAICVITAMVCEALFQKMMKRPVTLHDGSAAITGVILALSLPVSAPWYVGFIAAGVGIGLGKAVFGGLGFNIFNPAMVGRAFVMLSFAKVMGAGAYILPQAKVAALTQATPLSQAKNLMEAVFKGKESFHLLDSIHTNSLFLGQVNGSIGEVSALCILLGGIYLLVTRTAAWQIPLGAILGLVVVCGPANWAGITPFTVLQHLLAGAFLFGAFFIATDPVTSPLPRWGRFWFGAGFGFLVGIIRVFSNYPEGVMFAILIMNALVPLLNRMTIPAPLGSNVNKPKTT
ncbi:MAG: RnfABCDGE type electron transport complex subunit D [Lentisphaerae bacterium]|nr:MAG: RnfABCDGE type electron transport complex subunit D [Lentisphaerota bacterium]